MGKCHCDAAKTRDKYIGLLYNFLTMIWKFYLFNGNSINKKDEAYDIVLENVNWRKLLSHDTEEWISEWHGVKVSPTLARSRLIEITWYVLADDRASSALWIDYLDNLFVLQDDFSLENNYLFAVIDEQDRAWDIKCKIKEPLEFIVSESDNEDFTRRKFRVVLQAPNPIFYWSDLKEVMWNEWVYGWDKIGMKLWSSLNSKFNIITLQNEWNVSYPLKIELTIKSGWAWNKPITVKNLTNGSQFVINSDAAAWDVIVIDSEKKELLKNGISIIQYRAEGSVFPSVKGQTSFSIVDNDWGLYDNDFDVKIYFRNALL